MSGRVSEHRLFDSLRLPAALALALAGISAAGVASAQVGQTTWMILGSVIDAAPQASGTTVLTASGPYIYVTRGNAVDRFRASDLALVGRMHASAAAASIGRGRAHRSPATTQPSDTGVQVVPGAAPSVAGLDQRRTVGAGDIAFHENPVSGNPGPEQPLDNRGLSVGISVQSPPQNAPALGVGARTGLGGRGAWVGTDPMVARGGFVYIVHGSTLYRLRQSDMTIVAQRELPGR